MRRLFLYTKNSDTQWPVGLISLYLFRFPVVCFDFLLDVTKDSCLYRQLMLPMAKARGVTLSLVSMGAFFLAVFTDNVFSNTKSPRINPKAFERKIRQCIQA